MKSNKNLYKFESTGGEKYIKTTYRIHPDIHARLGDARIKTRQSENYIVNRALDKMLPKKK